MCEVTRESNKWQAALNSIAADSDKNKIIRIWPQSIECGPSYERYIELCTRRASANRLIKIVTCNARHQDAIPHKPELHLCKMPQSAIASFCFGLDLKFTGRSCSCRTKSFPETTCRGTDTHQHISFNGRLATRHHCKITVCVMMLSFFLTAS